ncbi:MAG: hypothetical protein M1820_007845 [Bogoriella megaspora]|nr:MAG: hypothetical protein M1820_007845 [Bogoriella megaspora]
MATKTSDMPNGITQESHFPGEKQVKDLINLVKLAARPVPDATGDGTYIPGDPRDNPFHGLEDVLDTVSKLTAKDYKSLAKLVHLQRTNQPWNDREYVMESLIQIASKLPADNKLGSKLTDGFITKLYKDLEHPPQSYLGQEFQYRRADGSGNSILYPHVGAANTPYARTVQPRTVKPAALPDPGVLFDSLLARQKPEKHVSGISSMLFYLASIIIHDLFRTDHVNFANSKTSSYLDLSPLYGSVWEEQQKVRTFQDGKLKPDCFSEVRVLGFPPGVGALLIMFNRFHNYVVEQLASIDENGRFSRSKQKDEELFQTGRLITCGLYVSIILGDYLRTIMNLNRTNYKWLIDPRRDIQGLPKGSGNQVSAEFNLIYRWHSVVSERDIEFTEEYFRKLFPGRNIEEVEEPELLRTLGQLEGKLQATDPEMRDFHGYVRQADGKFSDDDLAEIMVSSIEDCGNAFGARTVPTIFKAVEALGIKQSRAWQLATLNEFRAHFNLATYKTFEEINPDPYVANQLKHLYDHPDNVEIYPGLAIEGNKRTEVPGSGLVPPFTIARALFADATTTIRGDRFYAIEHTPKQLTNWGFSEQAADLDVDNGCCFYKLFLRALPNHFKQDSMYAHYPLTIPEVQKGILRDLETIDLYSTERPERMGSRTVISAYKSVCKVLQDQDVFKATWGEAIESLGGPEAKEFILLGDSPTNGGSIDLMRKALYPTGWDVEVKTYFEKITTNLLAEKWYHIANTPQVDIIRDIGNLAPVHFVSELFCLPLKTHEEQHRLYTEVELREMMTACYLSFFFDPDPEHSFDLRHRARGNIQLLAKDISANLVSIRDTGYISKLLEALPWGHKQDRTLKSYGTELIKRLLESDRDVRHLAWSNIIWSAAGIVSTYSSLFGQAIDYFLTAGRQHLPILNKLAKQDDKESDEQLLRYFLEATRLSNESGTIREAAVDTTLADNGKNLDLNAQDRVIVNIKAASHDPSAFPEPTQFDLKRPLDSYIHLGFGSGQEGLGAPMANVALTAMFKTVMRLDNLRPVVGPQGQVKKILRGFGRADGDFGYHPLQAQDLVKEEGYNVYLNREGNTYLPFPTTLRVNWDEAGLAGS